MLTRTLLLSCFLCVAACSARERERAPTSRPRPQSAERPAPRVPRFDPMTTDAGELELGGTHLAHPTPYIPSQCYTKTRDAAGHVHNPCYTCHQDARVPNYVSDPELQRELSFPGPSRRNPWTNLFTERAREIAAITDDAIRAYVAQSNYIDADGALVLARRLTTDLPPGWDIDDDHRWGGYVPDAYFHFDARGFDVAPDGRPTGWRAFAYYPFLGTFFPTNGSTDDVLIRLPAHFRERADGTYDEATYVLNLAVLEALVRREDVTIEPTDEALYGVDLDRDGRIGRASKIDFAWDPRNGVEMRFVGRAKTEQDAGRLPALAGLFPLGTEFLHSVRYVAVTDAGVGMAPRMKELRYAKKTRLYGYGELEQKAIEEAREENENPDALEEISGNPEVGVSNRIGWVYQGFIEARDGALRPQTFEEHAFCVGCHGGIGATTDGVFAFPRKLGPETFARGWFHPTQHTLAGVPDPVRADGRGEFATYLRVNGAGDELRSNAEVMARFFDAEGRERPDAFAALGRDIETLLLPSAERALALDKAYLTIVRAQSYRLGRDATARPATEVHQSVDPESTTGVEVSVAGPGSLHTRR